MDRKRPDGLTCVADAALTSADAEARDAFELFVEKADRLLDSAFVRHLAERKLSFTIRYDANTGIDTELQVPPDENVDAFLLTFRFFIQDNETISFRNMATAFDEAKVSDELRAAFHSVRGELNAMLNENTMVNLDGHKLKRGELLHVFLYGHFAHADAKKRRTILAWRDSAGPVFSLLLFQFVETLTFVLEIIACARQICREALERHPASGA